MGRVVQPLAVEWHVGDAATALAAFLGVERLPGAALIPPFCYAANCEVRLLQRCRFKHAQAPLHTRCEQASMKASHAVRLNNLENEWISRAP